MNYVPPKVAGKIGVKIPLIEKVERQYNAVFNRAHPFDGHYCVIEQMVEHPIPLTPTTVDLYKVASILMQKTMLKTNGHPPVETYTWVANHRYPLWESLKQPSNFITFTNSIIGDHGQTRIRLKAKGHDAFSEAALIAVYHTIFPYIRSRPQILDEVAPEGDLETRTG